MGSIATAVEQQLKEILVGCDTINTEDELRKKLTTALESGRPLLVKFGADPSRPDIHLGHTVVLHKLRCFQDLGHQVAFVIGDFTARIGDPTGRSKTRPELSVEQVKENAATYEEQVFKILDREKTQVVYNSEWLEDLNAMDFLRLLATRTVQQLLVRDDFQKRYNQQNPVYLHEFAYPLLQAYDSVVLKADIELGGTDQTFNLMMGRELQKQHQQAAQVVMTMPLLEGLDGVQKMSKSFDNYISVTDSPTEMFGKTMSISDSHMLRFYELIGQVDADELANLRQGLSDQSLHPMVLKKKLAEMIVARYWGSESGSKALTEFEARFSRKEVPQELQEYKAVRDDDGLIDIIGLSVALGFSKSRSEARRILKQKGMKLDGQPIVTEKVIVAEAAIFRQGKIKMIKIL